MARQARPRAESRPRRWLSQGARFASRKAALETERGTPRRWPRLRPAHRRGPATSHAAPARSRRADRRDRRTRAANSRIASADLPCRLARTAAADRLFCAASAEGGATGTLTEVEIALAGDAASETVGAAGDTVGAPDGDGEACTGAATTARACDDDEPDAGPRVSNDDVGHAPRCTSGSRADADPDADASRAYVTQSFGH